MVMRAPGGRMPPRPPWRSYPVPAMKIVSFGRFKGRRLGELPGSFLGFLSRQLEGTSWARYAQMIMDWRDRLGIHGGNRIERLSAPALRGSPMERRRRLLRERKYGAILMSCFKPRALSTGKWMHDRIARKGLQDSVFLGNLLIKLYGKCGVVGEARAVFDALGNHRNAFSSILMMVAYAQNGDLASASEIFRRMPYRDVVAWTGMIALNAEARHYKDAIDLYRGMLCDGMKPVRIGFITALDACVQLRDVATGRLLHAHIIESGIQWQWKVMNSLIAMYGFCGCLDEAKAVFWKLLHKDRHDNKLSRALLMAAYAASGVYESVLKIFQGSKDTVLYPIAFIVALEACSVVRDAELGKVVQSKMPRIFQLHEKMGSALVNMYASCGCVKKARECFDRIKKKKCCGVLSWTAIIAAYAANGQTSEALDLFRKMLIDGASPNQETFAAVVAGFCREERLDEAVELLFSMVEGHGITQRSEDLRCVADLLARLGNEDGAKELRTAASGDSSLERGSKEALRPRVVDDVYTVLRQKLLPKHVEIETWLDTDLPDMPFSRARHPLEVASEPLAPRIPKREPQPSEEEKLEKMAKQEEKKRARERHERFVLRKKARIRACFRKI